MINVGTSWCLHDSANGYDQMKAVNASTTVKRCDKGSKVFGENMFYLDLITIKNHEKCAPLEYANVDGGNKKKADSNKSILKVVPAIPDEFFKKY